MATKVEMKGPCKFCGAPYRYVANSLAEARRLKDAVFVCDRKACNDAWTAECEAAAQVRP